MAWDLRADIKEGGYFAQMFILWPKQWLAYDAVCHLDWKSIPYKKTRLGALPARPGVYAFVACPSTADLADCHYLLYVGKAEDQTLRVRCKQYLYECRRPKPRRHIVRMFDRWKRHLSLYYAELDPAHVSITCVEDALLAAFLPPCNTKFPGKLQEVAEGIYHG
jgi:hypothetical protein